MQTLTVTDIIFNMDEAYGSFLLLVPMSACSSGAKSGDGTYSIYQQT